MRVCVAADPQHCMNRAIARRSSPIVVTREVACHAGGRGFESRRSRLAKDLQISRSSGELDARTVEEATRFGSARLPVRLEFDAAGDIVRSSADARPRLNGKKSVRTTMGRRFRRLRRPRRNPHPDETN
jgi:hypothetical protein